MGERPENTAVSFKKALSDGADGIEFDVHLTVDGIPVVMHDEKVDRTTDGQGLIVQQSIEDIKKLDTGSYYGDKYRGEKILTLEETLEIAINSQIINIELKQGPVIYQRLEDKVMEIVNYYKIADKIIISSFNHYSLRYLKERYLDQRCGLLYMAGIYQPWNYAGEVGVEAIHPFYASINEDIINQCHENGIMVNVFGANDEKSISGLLEAGVDGIITDYPGMAIKLRDEQQIFRG